MSGNVIVKRGFVDTPAGQIHYRSCGIGKPVIMLHQTPRSSDEFLEVLPLIGSKFWAIAMDMIGFGDSYRFEGEMTIERLAMGVIEFASALNIEKFSLVGHHTGAVVAIEVAASFPSKVEKLVLSGCPYIDEEERQKRRNKEVIDSYESKVDGSHLIQLWRGRLPYYPQNRPDLLDRFIIDALKAGRNAAEGHKAVARYKMEEKLPRIKCPTLLIAGKADPFSYPYISKLRQNILNVVDIVEIDNGTVALVEQFPDKFAEAVLKFLSNRGDA
jgi:pimeloyl-ACP methyl ester carboxylesterase